jgi:Fe-S cluster assembly protein SufD
MSRMLLRGIAIDSGQADITGQIKIGPTGQGTDGHLAHEGLLLSPKARINALPGFEIATNDVKAAHSSAVHYIKPEQLFYLVSRGLNEADARQLMIRGFLESMLGIIREPDVKERLEGLIAADIA